MPQLDGNHRRRAAGELEDEVLATLWSAGQPLTPGQVQELLDGDLAYNTVLTILGRLLEKGILARTPSGRGHRYFPTDAAEARTAERMAELLDRGPNRQSVLQRFVTELKPEDEKALRKLLRRPPE